MIPRYTPPEMGRIWTDQRRYETWLSVECAAADAMAVHGLIPADAARDIRERGKVDAARVDEIERTTRHDVIAFTTAVAEHVGPSARWLHFGLTSSDVLDTAQALQLRESCDLLLADVDKLLGAIRDRAFDHKHTPAWAASGACGVPSYPTRSARGITVGTCYYSRVTRNVRS